jgi:predicted DCC family thiol-disulfide oxidoreductase YuxK
MKAVFYDGKCGLCRREINHYRKLEARLGLHKFEWVDVAADVSAAQRLGVSQADALMHLHAIDGQGHVHKGIDVFALIWEEFPRWNILGKVVKLPVMNAAARLAYEIFARVRFAAYPHCKIASKEAPSNRGTTENA